MAADFRNDLRPSESDHIDFCRETFWRFWRSTLWRFYQKDFFSLSHFYGFSLSRYHCSNFTLKNYINKGKQRHTFLALLLKTKQLDAGIVMWKCSFLFFLSKLFFHRVHFDNHRYDVDGSSISILSRLSALTCNRFWCLVTLTVVQ